MRIQNQCQRLIAGANQEHQTRCPGQAVTRVTVTPIRDGLACLVSGRCWQDQHTLTRQGQNIIDWQAAQSPLLEDPRPEAQDAMTAAQGQLECRQCHRTLAFHDTRMHILAAQVCTSAVSLHVQQEDAITLWLYCRFSTGWRHRGNA